MKTAIATLSMLLLLGAGACSDDDDPPAPDTGSDGAVSDQGPQAEGGTPDRGPEADLGPDLPGSNLNCAQVVQCSNNCTASCPDDATKLQCFIQCTVDCKAIACNEAKAPFDALYTCIGAQCITECASGGTAACQTCTETKCAAQWTTCSGQSCP